MCNCHTSKISLKYKKFEVRKTFIFNIVATVALERWIRPRKEGHLKRLRGKIRANLGFKQTEFKVPEYWANHFN